MQTLALKWLFECPALQNLHTKHLGPDFADKQVLINNPEDVAEFQLEINRSVRYLVDPGQKTKKKKISLENGC